MKDEEVAEKEESLSSIGENDLVGYAAEKISREMAEEELAKKKA